MKEDVKMKEKMNAEPTGTMPQVGPMQHMQANPSVSPVQTIANVSPVQAVPNVSPVQAAPNILPAQTMPNALPAQMNNAGVMPSMMNQMPIMCCPYLMNMQCPMTYGQNVMGMMNNQMYPGVSPVSGNMGPMNGNAGPVLGAANNGMNAFPGMGVMPAMSNNQYFPMGGMY